MRGSIHRIKILVQKSRMSLASMSRTIYLLVLLAGACSGSPIAPRILGGADADIADFPYMLSVDFSGHYCGAVIVSAEWALTDAWCSLAPVDFTKYSIRSGSAFLGNGTFHNITQWKHHPLSDEFNSVYDFAMIQVDPPFEFGENVAAVGLPEQGQESPDGADALIAGWGEVDGSDSATIDHLQFASTKVFSDAACSDHLASDYADSKLCAQDPNGLVAHCWYDEGGPLVVNGTLFGIALWPSYCNNPLEVEVYSRVAIIRDWIDFTISSPVSTTSS